MVASIVAVSALVAVMTVFLLIFVEAVVVVFVVAA